MIHPPSQLTHSMAPRPPLSRMLKLKDAFEKERKEWLQPLADRKYDVVVVAPQNAAFPAIINEHRLMALEMVRAASRRPGGLCAPLGWRACWTLNLITGGSGAACACR